MRIAAVLSDGHDIGVDPQLAVSQDRQLVAALQGRLDGIVLRHGWATSPRWNPQALTYASFLAADRGPLHLTLRGVPLDVRNPIELAEQLGSLDHAWSGRLVVGLARGTQLERAWFGIAPAATRFDEGLALVRRMWALEPFSGEGPVFEFDEVRPTLRPITPGGPPLCLEATDRSGAQQAAELALGLHIAGGSGSEDRADLIAAYRDAGGAGELSLQVDHHQTQTDELERFAEQGVNQLDVILRRPGDDPDSVSARVEDLVERATAAGHGVG